MRFIRPFALLVILTACSAGQMPFDSEKWQEEADVKLYPYRERMLEDIINNKRLAGLSRQDITALLGEPENYSDTNENELWYVVDLEYGMDIDPIHIKHLVLTLDADSIVQKVEVRVYSGYES